MIMITLGSQKFQFNRLLMVVDRLVAEGKIQDDIFAQTGCSTYVPKHFKSEAFLDQSAFNEMMENANLIIAHGGAGSIVTALKMGKRVIAVPRRRAFHEHVDDHQFEIIRKFDEDGRIVGCYDPEDLIASMKKVQTLKAENLNVFEGESKIEKDIMQYLNTLFD